MAGIPKIATVYRNYLDKLYITVRQNFDMHTSDCNMEILRGNSFNRVYLINMEESALPEDLKSALQLCLLSSGNKIESVYYNSGI